MSSFMLEIDARTRLAGANRMELLLFHLGGSEVYGINVFKVREVMKMPALTIVPEADSRIIGMASLRGKMVPVIDLRQALHLPVHADDDMTEGHLIISEYNLTLQGLFVAGVDRIMRVSWDQVKAPPTLVKNSVGQGAVTAVTLLDDGRMVMILDVEKILADICPRAEEEIIAAIQEPPTQTGKRVFFADDSVVARKQIVKTLERMGFAYTMATTGAEAWQMLQGIAAKAAEDNKGFREVIQVILTDIEMPEMDGFTLVKNIRADPRFQGVPIIMHSSLTGTCNMEKGQSVGATDYVTKFDPKILAEKLALHAHAR
jgi:two-component system chemotaxis response regulator CheV